jgi:hypothetical protein
VTVDSYRIAYGYYTKLTRMANFFGAARMLQVPLWTPTMIRLKGAAPGRFPWHPRDRDPGRFRGMTQ